MTPSIGCIVHLRLSAECAASINKRREDARASGIATTSSGAIVHAGNHVREGDEYPLIITRVWSEDEHGPGPVAVNGQVLLDGNDTLWATSVLEGDGPGQWHEPERI